VGWVRRSKWWIGLEGASGGVEACKYPETSCGNTFELGCRQVPEELLMCPSLDNSQKQRLTIDRIQTKLTKLPLD